MSVILLAPGDSTAVRVIKHVSALGLGFAVLALFATYVTYGDFDITRWVALFVQAFGFESGGEVGPRLIEVPD